MAEVPEKAGASVASADSATVSSDVLIDAFSDLISQSFSESFSAEPNPLVVSVRMVFDTRGSALHGDVVMCFWGNVYTPKNMGAFSAIFNNLFDWAFVGDLIIRHRAAAASGEIVFVLLHGDWRSNSVSVVAGAFSKERKQELPLNDLKQFSVQQLKSNSLFVLFVCYYCLHSFQSTDINCSSYSRSKQRPFFRP